MKETSPHQGYPEKNEKRFPVVEPEYLAVHPAYDTKSNTRTNNASDKKICHWTSQMAMVPS